ncbi:6-bladed beta-propeller [Bacteroides pyogenes]|uniref:6-bladed beta-propeller n=3 Tax=Bacteroides pyogenes TaxID=310300 RepID=UPI001BA88015|nr:6-bladed beta-propeller [Bacteroides pyogenes]
MEIKQDYKYYHMYKVLFILITILLVSCENKQTKNSNEKSKKAFVELVTPNSLVDEYKELKLSRLADSVWYVPLETNKDLLLGDIGTQGSCKYVQNSFYIYDGQQGCIYVFSSDGKFQNRIGKIGQGANEIFQFLDYTTDGKLVYVADFGNKLHRYKKDGTYLGHVDLPKQAYKLMYISEDKIGCYITDNQFDNSNNAYSWLIVNAMGDSVSCRKTFKVRESENSSSLNHYVLHDFSVEYPLAYKEAFNDSLYYFDLDGNIRAYGYIDLGIHKINPSLSFDEVLKQGHAIRLSRIYDTPHYLLAKGRCFCIKDKMTCFVWNKDTNDFFCLQDFNITNDLGGPDFQPLSCAYPGLLIGLAEPADCPQEFIKQYNMKLDDNPVLVMVKCKQQ